MIRGLLFAVAVILAVTTGAVAQSPRLVPAGFCAMTSMSSSTSILQKCGGINLGTTTYAVICAYTQGVVWRDDGGVPTGTPGTGGQGIAAGQCIPYNATFTALRFIQQSSGAVVGIAFYR